MVRCGLGIKQCAMHNATIQETTFVELGVYTVKLKELIRPKGQIGPNVTRADFVDYRAVLNKMSQFAELAP